MNELGPQDFIPHIGKAFRVVGFQPMFLLARVDQRRREDWELELPFREPFNIIFHGPSETILPEGLHILEAEGIGRFELYVIPVHTPARDRQDYQVSFN